MKDTKSRIIIKALGLFAQHGYEGISMRLLAEKVHIAPSVLYHYFQDKDALLKALFDITNTDLGIKRAKLPQPATAAEMLRQRIIFQLDNAEAIVAVLKYFLTYRKKFPKQESGFIPNKGYLHIQEVLEYGQQTGEFESLDIAADAKVITHAINGFLLEYYPHKVQGKEKELLVNEIHSFLLRALQKGGEKHARIKRS